MQKVTGLVLIAATASAALSVMGQQQKRPAGQQERRPGGTMNRRMAPGGMMGGGFDQSMFLLRVMDDPAMAETLKLTDEQKDAFKKGTTALDERKAVVREALNIAALEQAAVAAKIMADKQASTDELMALVEKIGGLKTEQAKIQTEKLLVIRDTLTDEQIRSASEVVKKRVERIRERMQQRGDTRSHARRGDTRNAPLPQRPKGWDE